MKFTKSFRYAGAVLLFGLATTTVAQEPDQAACRSEVLQGRVEAGEGYEAVLSPSLVFRLDAEAHEQNPPGWTIRIAPPSAADDDYSMVATPPYRSFNPRYVDTSYGTKAEAALLLTPRRFAFVGSADHYRAASEALGVLLWPGAHTPGQVEAARTTMSELPTYPGTFWIEDGGTIAPDSTNPLGLIAWMSFRVEVCVPRGPRAGDAHSTEDGM